MTRYMFYVSYLGTRFSGSQFQRNSIGAQNVLNNALALVLNVPCSVIKTTSASRTDAGVHALRTTYTVKLLETIECNRLNFNLKFKSNGKLQSLPYDPDTLCAAVNHVLKDMDFDMRILACHAVADGFCPRRHAMSRSYLYRLLVLKSEFDNDSDRPLLLRDPAAFAPLMEKDRSWAIDSNFDPEKFYRVAKLFEGLHDFRSFSSQQSMDPNFLKPSTHREVKLVEVLKGTPLIDPRFEPLSDCFHYVDILVHARSFVYRQIRKMVSFMVAAAKSQVTDEDLKWLLDNPMEINWAKYDLSLAPSGGLYLMNITYDKKDFENPSPVYGDPTESATAAEKDSSIEDEEELLDDTADDRVDPYALN